MSGHFGLEPSRRCTHGRKQPGSGGRAGITQDRFVRAIVRALDGPKEDGANGQTADPPSNRRSRHVSLVALPDAAASTLFGIFDVMNAFER